MPRLVARPCGLEAQLSRNGECVMEVNFGCYSDPEHNDEPHTVWVTSGCRGIFYCHGNFVWCDRPSHEGVRRNCSCTTSKPLDARTAPTRLLEAPQQPFLGAMSRGVCIEGSQKLLHSNAYFHFMHGHLLPTFQHLHARQLYRPDLQLAFGTAQHGGGNFNKYFPFYEALFNSQPTIVPRCKPNKLPAGRWTLGRFAPFNLTIMRGDSGRNYEEYRIGAANSSIAQGCELLPTMHALAAAHRGARPRGARPARLLLVRRNATRGIANGDEVAAALSQVARGARAEFESVSFDGTPAAYQVGRLLEADVLVGYHGSGLGGSHHWMPPGGVVVEIMPPRWPSCVVATCAAPSAKAHVMLTTAYTSPARTWKNGGWFAREPGPSGRRVVRLPGELLTLLHRALSAAAPCVGGAKQESEGGGGGGGRGRGGGWGRWRCGNGGGGPAATDPIGGGAAASRATTASAMLPATTPRDALAHAARSVCTELGGARARRRQGCAPACDGRTLQVWERIDQVHVRPGP